MFDSGQWASINEEAGGEARQIAESHFRPSPSPYDNTHAATKHAGWKRISSYHHLPQKARVTDTALFKASPGRYTPTLFRFSHSQATEKHSLLPHSRGYEKSLQFLTYCWLSMVTVSFMVRFIITRNTPEAGNATALCARVWSIIGPSIILYR